MKTWRLILIFKTILYFWYINAIAEVIRSSTESTVMTESAVIKSPPFPKRKWYDRSAQEILLIQIPHTKPYKLAHSITDLWDNNETIKKCLPNENRVDEFTNEEVMTFIDNSINKLVEEKKDTSAYKKYLTSCRTPNPNNDHPTDSCIVHLINLVAEVYEIDYPLTQCIMGRETIQPDGAPKQANHLYQYTRESNIRYLKENKSFSPTASWIGGRGLAQLTSPAIKAVQELLGNLIAPQRFDCSFYKKFLTFYKLIEMNPPNLFIPHDKSIIPSDEFNTLNPFHSLSIGAGYIYDRTILDGKIKPSNHKIVQPKYTFKLREKIANGYNPGKPEYGEAIALCSESVQRTIKGVEIYDEINQMYDLFE